MEEKLLHNGARLSNRPRIPEIAAFARAMGYCRLDLIFCTGPRREAADTALAAKDRMPGRNPLAAVHCGNAYFNDLNPPI